MSNKYVARIECKNGWYSVNADISGLKCFLKIDSPDPLRQCYHFKNGRLHNEDGPAVIGPKSTAYALNGSYVFRKEILAKKVHLI